MSDFLKKAIGEVVGAARANPDAAPQIFGEAARHFFAMASDPRNAKDSKSLIGAANQFKRASSPARFGTDFEVLLRDHHKAYMATPDAESNDLEVYGRQGIVQADGGDAGGDDDDDEDDIVGGSSAADKDVSFHLKAAPPSVSFNTPIGRGTTLKWNPTTQDIANGIKQQDTVILWQGNKFESQTMTVDIGVNKPLPEGIGDNTPLRPYAQIEYGADGFREIITIDVGFGTRLTMAGNYLSVLLGMGPAPGTGPAIVIGASMGFFAATSTAPVTYTQYTDGLASGSRDVFQRPFKSTVMYPPQCNQLGTYEVRFYSTQGTLAVFKFDNTVTNPVLSPIIIPNDVYKIEVKNTGALSASFRTVFQLAL
jgi:hypothetical protein